MADISDGSPAIESATMESEARELSCCSGARQSYHEIFLIKYVCMIILFLMLSGFQFSVRCLPCRRKADKGASHQPQKLTIEILVQKLRQRCHIPHYLYLRSAGNITRQLQYSDFPGERHPSSPSRSQHPVRDSCAPSISFPWMTCLCSGHGRKKQSAQFCVETLKVDSECSVSIFFFLVLPATSRVRRWRKHGP